MCSLADVCQSVLITKEVAVRSQPWLALLTHLPPTLRKCKVLFENYEKIEDNKIKQIHLYLTYRVSTVSTGSKYNIICLCLIIFLNYVKVAAFHVQLVVMFKICFLAEN